MRTLTPAWASAPKSLAATPLRRTMPRPTTATRAMSFSTRITSGLTASRMSHSSSVRLSRIWAVGTTTHMESMPVGRCSMEMPRAAKGSITLLTKPGVSFI